jgi:hypothetical protein
MAMKSQHLYITLAAVLVLFAGFIGLRHFKGEENQSAHRIDTFQRLTEAAARIPHAGMTQMAYAVVRYQKDNGKLPPNLQALHPKYIPHKAFIDRIHWEYKVSGGDFLITKRVQRKGEVLLASTDSSMKIVVGSQTPAVVASRTQPPGSVENTEVMARLKRELDLMRSIKAPSFALEKPSEKDHLGPLRTETRIVEAEEEPPPSLVQRTSRDYLVWRDEEGHLGFGNVQYPERKRFAIATPEQWISVRYHHPEAGRGPGFEDPPSGVGRIAGRSGDLYLAWRSADGVLGFGNVQYPDKRRLGAVYQEGKWASFVQGGTAAVP